MTIPTICLNMIVRNESRVIARCLSSVLPFISNWVIVDTGSTDGTQDIIRKNLAGVHGQLYEREWKSFEYNRNEALMLAQGWADYIFWIDADETLSLQERPLKLTLDAYYLTVDFNGLLYQRCCLIKSSLRWYWEGVVHEVLHCRDAFSSTDLPMPIIHPRSDGARSRDPKKYIKDAQLLEKAMRSDPNNTRYAFYLAQSYRDAGQLEKAWQAYKARAAMQGWEEEVFYSLFQVAVLSERIFLRLQPAQRLNLSEEIVAADYLKAFQNRPTRAEPLVHLARFHRERCDYALAFMYAKHATTILCPNDILFIDRTIYAWRALDELSISAYYCGRFDEGRAATLKLLEEMRFPQSEKKRILQNAKSYKIESMELRK